MAKGVLTPGATQRLDATNTPVEYEVGGSSIRVVSDRNLHLKVDGLVSTDDFPIRAENETLIAGLSSGSKITFIKGSGETDGNIWVSKVTVS